MKNLETDFKDLTFLKIFFFHSSGLDYWTSGNGQGQSKGSFFWMSNGQEMSFTNWEPGAPGGNDQIAISGQRGTWANRWWTDVYRYACEQRESFC